MYRTCNAVGLLDNSEFGKCLKIFQSLENQHHDKKHSSDQLHRLLVLLTQYLTQQLVMDDLEEGARTLLTTITIDFVFSCPWSP